VIYTSKTPQEIQTPNIWRGKKKKKESSFQVGLPELQNPSHSNKETKSKKTPTKIQFLSHQITNPT